MNVSSFTGDISNPITEARIEKSMSGPALAKRLGLSRQYISRAEQGTYSALNPALLKWVANAMSFTTEAVMQRYILFQKATRKATLERVAPHKLQRQSGNTESGHILFERWRSGYWTSPNQFAVAFCVHPDSVGKYEDGVQITMPSQIKGALVESNLIDDNWTDAPSKIEATGSPLRA